MLVCSTFERYQCSPEVFRLLKLALIAPALYPAAQFFGLPGVASVILGHTLVVSPIASYIAIQSIGGEFHEFLIVIFYPALGSPMMGLVVFAVRDSIEFGSVLIELGTLIVLGASVYLLILFGFERRI